MAIRLAGAVAVGATSALLAVPAVAGAATTTVEVGEFGKASQAAFRKASSVANAFFRRTVTIHQGDRVRWRLNGFHTVTFTPRGNPRESFVVPDAANPVNGVLDAGGSPFWFNGQPRLVFNPLIVLPQGPSTFDPAEMHNNGLDPGGPPKPYLLKFDRRGTFGYYCAVHHGMTGKVRVVGRNRPIPSARENRRAARRAQRVILQRAQARTTGVGTPQNVIQAGNDDRQGTAVYKFFPARKSVKAGTTLSLRMSPRSTEDHTFSFGPPAYLAELAQGLIAPVPNENGPPTFVAEPRDAYPSEPPGAGVPSLTAGLHGNGFLNTGFLNRDRRDPLPPSYRLRFAEPGTFPYICIVHSEMRGTVTVTS